jgi:hypothetical protein
MMSLWIKAECTKDFTIYNLLKEFNELFYEDLQDAVNDIFHIIDNEIDDSPYAIYGHSMGRLLAFELHPLTFTWI